MQNIVPQTSETIHVGDYLRTQQSLVDLNPPTAQENKLLLLNATAEELQFYRARFWNVENLVFSPGVARSLDLVSEKYSWYDIYERGVPNLNAGFHACIINHSAGQVEDLQLLLSLCAHLLLPGGKVIMQVTNAAWYFRYLALMDREIMPWVDSYPVGKCYTKQDLIGALHASPFSTVQVREIMDDAYHNPKIWDNQKVKGFGKTAVRLPLDSEERKQAFVRLFLVELVLENEGIKTAQHQVQELDMTALHQEIETLLENGNEDDLDSAKRLIDEIFNKNKADHRTENLFGIWLFYQSRFEDAYLKFDAAIQGGPLHRDYYLNLAEAAKRCGKEDDAKALIRTADSQLPGLYQEIFS